MKKTTIALVAACCLTACGNGQKANQPTADSTAVATEKQASEEVSEPESDEPISIDFETGVMKVNGVRYEFAHVEGGTFTMGATADMDEAQDNEKPAHKVTLTRDYYIGKTEVTWALWKAVMGEYPHDHTADGTTIGPREHPDNFPVDNVTWNQCQSFIGELNATFGECADFRLPTEAEWEFAARGGNKSKHYKYSGSNTLDEVAWYEDNSGRANHAVATKKPNELGIYDMSGNADEWCSDLWGNYSSKPQTDPRGPEGDEDGDYVKRGGNSYISAEFCMVSSRDREYYSLEGGGCGFRIAFIKWEGH